MEPAALIREYLLLGLRFDRIESGYVDAFTGDPTLRHTVAAEPTPDPADLARQARRLIDALPDVPYRNGFDRQRADYVGAHLRALECAGRKFAGEQIGFVDEVHDYFDVRISKGDDETYRQAHVRLDEALGGSGPLADRMAAHRKSEEIPPERLAECIAAFSSALRDRVRAEYPLPDTETVEYQVVTDKPWSGFNYYLGDYRSTVAVNADIKQLTSNLPRLVAHESYPGHHTEHCRKEVGLVNRKGHAEQTIFLVNTPQCLLAEGLADLALYAAIGPDWGRWATEIYADLGLRFDGERAEAVSEASAALAGSAPGRGVDAARRTPRRRRGRGLSAPLAAGRRRPGQADAEVFVVAAVARLHQHLCRGIPAVARLAGRPAGRDECGRAVRPAAGRTVSIPSALPA